MHGVFGWLDLLFSVPGCWYSPCHRWESMCHVPCFWDPPPTSPLEFYSHISSSDLTNLASRLWRTCGEYSKHSEDLRVGCYHYPSRADHCHTSEGWSPICTWRSSCLFLCHECLRRFFFLWWKCEMHNDAQRFSDGLNSLICLQCRGSGTQWMRKCRRMTHRRCRSIRYTCEPATCLGHGHLIAWLLVALVSARGWVWQKSVLCWDEHHS